MRILKLFPGPVKRKIKKVVDRIFKNRSSVEFKELNEFNYWKVRKNNEGDLKNYHYEYFYTRHFQLEPSFYNNKVILDIGCGPRGSLEWATMAKRRIGLDPLAKQYLQLGANKHAMEYIHAPSEKIPLPNELCDAVFSFNSLDHVANVKKTIKEIKRVLRPGGIFLLLVEVNHEPTVFEPHLLKPKEIIDLFEPEMLCKEYKVYKRSDPRGLYESIRIGDIFLKPLEIKEPGWMSASFVRQ